MHVNQAGINNHVPQNTVGCNYLSLPEMIPASGSKVHKYCMCVTENVLSESSTKLGHSHHIDPCVACVMENSRSLF